MTDPQTLLDEAKCYACFVASGQTSSILTGLVNFLATNIATNQANNPGSNGFQSPTCTTPTGFTFAWNPVAGAFVASWNATPVGVTGTDVYISQTSADTGFHRYTTVAAPGTTVNVPPPAVGTQEWCMIRWKCGAGNSAFTAAIGDSSPGTNPVAGSNAYDDLETYAVGSSLNGKNNGFTWSGAWVASNVTIVQKTAGGETDRRASFANGYIARPHGLGTAWTRMRVGVRYQLNNTGANITNPHFFVGLCNGTTAPVGAPVPSEAVGIYMEQETWTYSAAAGADMANFLSGNGNGFGLVEAKVIGGVVTAQRLQNDGTDRAYSAADDTAATRRVWMVDITKGAPNFVFRLFAANLATAAPDVLKSDFASLLSQLAPVFTNHKTWGPANLAFTETTPLDCVNVWWDKATPNVEILEIGCVVLA